MFELVSNHSFLTNHVVGQETPVEFIPRSGMCRTCKKLSFVAECAQLPFETMQVAKVYPDGTKAVICTEYQRAAV